MSLMRKIELDETVVRIKTEMNMLLEQVKEVDHDIAELGAMYEEQMILLKEQYAYRKKAYENKRAHYMMQIKALFEQVPHMETKTLLKVRLLGGDVILKKATNDFDYDKANLLEWAKSNKLDKFIESKQVENFKWSEFKKDLHITENGIIYAPTGEVLAIKGLGVKNIDAEMQVKY